MTMMVSVGISKFYFCQIADVILCGSLTVSLFHITGNISESYKVNDLNVQADASGDDDDGSDWEEG